MNIVVLNLSDYHRLQAYDEAAEKNYDIKISKGGYHIVYIMKNESEVVESLTKEIIELQEQLKISQGSKKSLFGK